MSRRRAILVLLVIAGCALVPSQAWAHPADMYAQDETITLTASGLRLEWRIVPGPFLADAAWNAADTNHDGIISADEAHTWVAPFLSGLGIMLDRKPIPITRIDGIHWPASVDVLRTGEDAITIRLSADWPAPLAGRHALEIHNGYLEANSLNWFSLAGGQGVTFGRPAQDNGRLTFDLFLPTASPSSMHGLTAWTSGTPNLPDFSTSLLKLAGKLAGSPEGSYLGSSSTPGSISAVTSALTGLVRNVQFSPYFLLSAFLLSLALGSLHALTPGHGKALVAAYLVGSQGRARDAVLLGGIVTLTHTGSVLLLGLATLLISHYIVPSLIVPWLELASGVLVIVFGLNLLVQRAWRGSQTHGHAHADEHIHLAARAPIGQRRSRGAGLSDSRIRPITAAPLRPENRSGLLAPWRPAQRTEAQSARRETKITGRSLAALGISGGLVPCPDAIAILLVAVALNRIPFGMLLIAAFSLGLAVVLIGIGVAMVRGVSVIQHSVLRSHRDWLTRFGAYTPVISAIVVAGLGAGLTFNAWKSFQFSASMSGRPDSPRARIAKQSGMGAANIAAGNTGTSAEPILYIASDSSGHDQLFLQTQPGGTPVQYTQEPSGITGYSVSPDGGTILYSVFTVDGGSSIWSLQPDASGAVGAPSKVLDCPHAECNTPVFYPDASKVAYERLDDTTNTTTVPRFSIWWLDLQSGKTQPVFQDAAFPSTAPQFSRDGQWLSYISAASNTLVAFNLKNGRALSMPLGSQAALPEAWSPDGAALLFGDAIQNGVMPSSAVSQVAGGPIHVKTYSLATGNVIDLGGGPHVTDLAAAWSPDGKWIAVDREVPGGDSSASSNQVWLVQPDGSEAHVLLGEPGASYSSLSWSPDGRLLLYSRYVLDTSAGASGTGRFDVCSVDISTGQTTVLVPGGDIAQFLP